MCIMVESAISEPENSCLEQRQCLACCSCSVKCMLCKDTFSQHSLEKGLEENFSVQISQSGNFNQMRSESA